MSNLYESGSPVTCSGEEVTFEVMKYRDRWQLVLKAHSGRLFPITPQRACMHG